MHASRAPSAWFWTRSSRTRAADISRWRAKLGESRIYGGIHYRIDVDEGFVIARVRSRRAR